MKLAAIRYGAAEGARTDALIVWVASHLKGEGLRVGGAVQHNEADRDRRCGEMELEDPATGERVLICESMRATTSVCRVQEDALAKAVAWTRQFLNDGADILVINKFGKREAQGRGFTPAIDLAIDLGVPVLAGVSERNFEAWQALTRGQAYCLSASRSDVLGWCNRTLVARQTT